VIPPVVHEARGERACCKSKNNTDVGSAAGVDVLTAAGPSNEELNDVDGLGEIVASNAGPVEGALPMGKEDGMGDEAACGIGAAELVIGESDEDAAAGA
jgi:hypothetical protein